MTQGRAPDRYIVRELFGYPITASRSTSRSASGETDVYVMDTWYGYAVVASFPSRKLFGPDGRFVSNAGDLKERRLQAQARANLWNEEHRAWLHAGRWSDGRVS